MENSLPAIPAKRYFTIGEVSDLCGVKPYVLRYWEQEFTQLKPMKRRGNRRYYQHHEVLLIRRIRELLYEQGFTISGARNRLVEPAVALAAAASATELEGDELDAIEGHDVDHPIEATPVQVLAEATSVSVAAPRPSGHGSVLSTTQMRSELLSIRVLLTV
ncbi:MAG: MerR family transcriptional regulator [Burkholderiaceae bacterium]|nr:MerR family transcriptional regulator [Burkholderiaceae bacterium]